MKNFKNIWKFRNEIFIITWAKFTAQNSETSLGMFWTIFSPMVFVISMWFFFSVGLKMGDPVSGVPFLLSLLTSQSIWMMMRQFTISAPGILLKERVLVETLKLPVFAVPTIVNMDLLYTEIAKVMFTIIVFIVYGGIAYFPDMYYINFIYYWGTLLVFYTAVGTLLSAIYLLMKDIKPLVRSAMVPMMWITPVFYIPQDPTFELLIKIFNPFYFFIDGYRKTLLLDKFFFEDIWYNIYFWVLILVLFKVGFTLWDKLKVLQSDLA